ncbi:amidohydrolase family protein [Phycisphaerales bacterium AB-hyl4]|uniref:Amidohydrolase family protein n=1 Tax=Natronomicrosphaera hydrolytica TaxID=3242702 RepID=A0ABV4U6F0_9BACT
MKRNPTTLYLAAAIRDAGGHVARPGAIAVRDGRVVDAGHPNDISRRLRNTARTVELPEDLLLPAMVNAHAHLDLTHVPAVDYTGDFLAWLKQVRTARPTDFDAVGAAVAEGLRLSREAGVGYVGDIAGSVDAIRARHAVGEGLALPGVSYLECFGFDTMLDAAADRIEAWLDPLPFDVPVPGHVRGVTLGIQPHAPYSVGRTLYDAATRLSHKHIYRLSTHLAESPAELEFVRDATGPFVDLLRELGKLPDTLQATGKHPIDWLEPNLKRGRWLLAHCNYIEDRHITTLKRTGTSVVYCPLASEYFGHPEQGQHRYREMLAAGVNVCLGTDSLLCQQGVDQPMGIMPQMRRLYARDETAPELLLEMATTHGRLALEFSDTDATLRRGAPAVFTAVRIDPDDATDPLTQALTNDHPARSIHAELTDESND